MTRITRLVMCAVLVLAALSFAISSAAAHEFNDSHFHVTNYVQEGLSLPDFLKIMGDKVGRAAVFGIPLQQKWDHFESGDRVPDYYLLSDAELYAMLAEARAPKALLIAPAADPAGSEAET